MKQSFVVVAGEAASRDLFDGVDTTWRRVAGGEAVGHLVEQANSDFTAEHPGKAIPALIRARHAISALKAPWAERKLAQLDEAIALCAGIWVDAAAERAQASPASKLRITLTALNRGRSAVHASVVHWDGTATAKPESVSLSAELKYNVPATHAVDWTLAQNQPYTQPYWLTQSSTGDVYAISSQELIGLPDNPPLLEARFKLNVAGVDITLRRSVVNRIVDRARGEMIQPLAIVPAVSIAMPETALVFANGAARRIEVPVRSNAGAQSGSVSLRIPDGWRVEPATAQFTLNQGEQNVLPFTVTPPASGEAQTTIQAEVKTADGQTISKGMDVIGYDHIPVQTLFPDAASEAVAVNVKSLATRVGYVMGAGDDVPESLAQIGCEITLLGAGDLARADLSRFDAIVTGVRAWNVRPDLRANRQRLLDYMQRGGTLVVQYNVLEGGFGGGDPHLLDGIGPYPIRISRARVSVEEAPVRFPNPSHPLIQAPNPIGVHDFEGWVQERGLYFASEWDPRYHTLFECHDPGEQPLAGGTLVTKYGKGAYVFTAYSWFRQLPEGVAGAYRIFANFLSAGKVLADVR
jgi:hypothetical protein